MVWQGFQPLPRERGEAGRQQNHEKKNPSPKLRFLPVESVRRARIRRLLFHRCLTTLPQAMLHSTRNLEESRICNKTLAVHHGCQESDCKLPTTHSPLATAPPISRISTANRVTSVTAR